MNSTRQADENGNTGGAPSMNSTMTPLPAAPVDGQVIYSGFDRDNALATMKACQIRNIPVRLFLVLGSRYVVEVGAARKGA